MYFVLENKTDFFNCDLIAQILFLLIIVVVIVCIHHSIVLLMNFVS